ncbi:MAG TPA: DUF1587 domain-containing protein, partial [Verrucomicrobiae bacterium]|nr:DUF1587 domain-containing protein [Verrucomicrobiae bacterium]
MALRGPLAALLFPCALMAASDLAPSFEQNVKPILSHTCGACHNDRLLSGSLDIAPLLRPESIATDRDMWERILSRIRSGEMPPKGIPRPPADQIAALVSAVQAEFDRADRAARPDPGRVAAHRLNRAEYANTVRDLLGVDFRADEEFPADDSG